MQAQNEPRISRISTDEEMNLAKHAKDAEEEETTKSSIGAKDKRC